MSNLWSAQGNDSTASAGANGTGAVDRDEPPPDDSLSIDALYPDRAEVLVLHQQVSRSLAGTVKGLRGSMIVQMAKGDRLVRESMERQAEQLHRELAGPCPTLAQQVWVELTVHHSLAVRHARSRRANAAAHEGAEADDALQQPEASWRKLLQDLRAMTERGIALPAALLRLAGLEPGAAEAEPRSA
jgi:hypothetical protein